MNEPFTPGAKRVLARARQIAEANGHAYVGSEHVLLGLLGEPDGIVPGLIEVAGLNMKDLNEKVTKAAKDAWGTPAIKTPDLKAVAETLRSLADLMSV